MYGNRDQLIQVFLNLIKNAAEAIGSDAQDGEIILSTAYRPGVQVQLSGNERVRLPLEISVRDNGPGVPTDMLPDLFDPFVTTKAGGTGLGLALVARIIGELGLEQVMFEAADPPVFQWYIKNYGNEVNLFVDHSQIVLYYMEGNRLKKHHPSRPYDRYVLYNGLTFTGALVAKQLNTSGIYDIA